MAKKKHSKNRRKKAVYRQKHTTQAQKSATDVAPSVSAPNKAEITKEVISSEPKARVEEVAKAPFASPASRVVKEVRHSLGLAAIVFIALVGLWILLTHTSLGHSLYSIIKL